MKQLSVVLTLSVLTCGISLVDLSRASAEDKCGDKGQPSCPLQGWMEKNMQPPLDDKDFKKLIVALKKSASFVPDPKWNQGDKAWKKWVEDGVKAANAKDVKAIKASCKGCHKAWRKKYRKEHRMKPVK